MHSNDPSNTHAVLACYASAERAERARAQLQRAGIKSEVHEPPVDSEDQSPEDKSGSATTIELCGRTRDRRKARAVLSAMHLLPDSESTADTDESESKKPTTDASPPNADSVTRSEMPIKQLSNSDPPSPNPSEEAMPDGDEASTSDYSDYRAEASGSTTLLQRVSFWQMAIWGAALLALGTLLLLLFGGQA